MGDTTKIYTQQKLINAIKTNDSVILKGFYKSNYPKIEVLVIKNNGSKEQAKDIYQEAFITVWKNIKLDKFKPINETSLNGYLYTIAKNKWMDVLRSNKFKKTTFIGDKNLFLTNIEDDEISDVKDERIEKIMFIFKNLGQPCKQLLTTFYFDKKSLRDIASELKLEEASIRNKKYRCMKKLRTIVLASNL